MLVDSHCHLDFPDFDDDRIDIINRAVCAGVTRMVSICTRPRQFDQVRQIAEAHAPVFFAAGMHPLNAHEKPHPSLDMLLQWAQHPKLVGIGEAGLDYHYRQDTADAQKQTFLTQIEAARRTKLPLIVHARDADADMADMLKEAYAKGPFSCVMHCFSSGAALAETALSLGFYLSMSGIATFKKAQEIRDIFAAAPIDRILVETDSPYLAPPPHRGKRNEPAYVKHTARVGAAIFGMEPDAFAIQTSANFDRLFWKAAG
jgi:TatD DNase family protein